MSQASSGGQNSLKKLVAKVQTFIKSAPILSAGLADSDKVLIGKDDPIIAYVVDERDGHWVIEIIENQRVDITTRHRFIYKDHWSILEEAESVPSSIPPTGQIEPGISDEQIRERAYALWEDGGRRQTESDEYWNAAKAMLEKEWAEQNRRT